jgi:hypothetical protein
MSDTTYDPRTCKAKQAAALAELTAACESLARETGWLAGALEALRARVAALEALHTAPAAAEDHVTDSGYTYREINAALTRTATPNQTYSWQPGGWVDQYAAAADAQP